MTEYITGMVFLGTPHHGVASTSGLTTQGNIYAHIVESEFQIQDNAIQTMAHDNEVLRNTVHNFTRRVKTCQPQPELFCFYEQVSTKVGLIVGLNESPVRNISGICLIWDKLTIGS